MCGFVNFLHSYFRDETEINYGEKSICAYDDWCLNFIGRKYPFNHTLSVLFIILIGFGCFVNRYANTRWYNCNINYSCNDMEYDTFLLSSDEKLYKHCDVTNKLSFQSNITRQKRKRLNTKYCQSTINDDVFKKDIFDYDCNWTILWYFNGMEYIKIIIIIFNHVIIIITMEYRNIKN